MKLFNPELQKTLHEIISNRANNALVKLKLSVNEFSEHYTEMDYHILHHLIKVNKIELFMKNIHRQEEFLTDFARNVCVNIVAFTLLSAISLITNCSSYKSKLTMLSLFLL